MLSYLWHPQSPFSCMPSTSIYEMVITKTSFHQFQRGNDKSFCCKNSSRFFLCNVFPFSVLMIFILLPLPEREEHHQLTRHGMALARTGAQRGNNNGCRTVKREGWRSGAARKWGKINRLSGWKHTKSFQVYVYIARQLPSLPLCVCYSSSVDSLECEAEDGE